MRWREHAEILLRKAGQDEYAMNKLALDPEAADEVIGFHAQQAVEKLLKAVLNIRAVAYRRTHDLMTLIDLLRESGPPLPPDLEDVCRLGPFAAEFRYDMMPPEGKESLDRQWIVGRVRRVRSWAESMIETKRDGTQC